MSVARLVVQSTQVKVGQNDEVLVMVYYIALVCMCAEAGE